MSKSSHVFKKDDSFSSELITVIGCSGRTGHGSSKWGSKGHLTFSSLGLPAGEQESRSCDLGCRSVVSSLDECQGPQTVPTSPVCLLPPQPLCTPSLLGGLPACSHPLLQVFLFSGPGLSPTQKSSLKFMPPLFTKTSNYANCP